MAHSGDPAAPRSRLVRAAAMSLFLVLAGPARAISAEPELAQCIANETATRPWLGKTLWGLRDKEGGWVGAEVVNTNGSADLGPLQINSSWVPRIASLIHKPEADVRSWLTHDTCFNVRAAQWIFLTALAVTKDYWRAVGLYHSPTAWRQRRYAYAVAAKLSQRFGPDVFVAKGGALDHGHDSQR